MLKIFSISLGCPKNRVDTEHLLGSLGKNTRLVAHFGRADVIFINTCGFILPAVTESVRTVMEAVQRMQRLKRRPLLVVAGCLVGRYGAKVLAQDLPEVDIWLDNADLPHWPAYIAQRLGITVPVQAGRLLSTGPSYAWLKISDGCRHQCAFCTIPLIRGRHRSIPAAILVQEAQELLNQGVKELVLVAQDVTAWGEDTGQKHGLVSLLEQLLPLDGLAWLRCMYLYPAGITKTLLTFMRDTGPAMLPYFDIPLQHAHPYILQRMGRPFARDPRTIIDRVRKIFPHAALRTTCIVGFPGENDAHFAHLQDFVRQTRFTHLGVFPYRAEEGTVAARMPEQVEARIIVDRLQQLMILQAEISEDILSAYVGQRMPVLVDAPHAEWPGLYTGRVWFQAPEVDGITYISGTDVAPNALLSADIVENAVYDLTALC